MRITKMRIWERIAVMTVCAVAGVSGGAWAGSPNYNPNTGCPAYVPREVVPKAYADPPPYFGTNPSASDIKAKLIAAGKKYSIPPHILFGIAFQESGWTQFRSDGRTTYHLEPNGEVGVGIMQITVSPSVSDYERLCTDIDYNIDRGADMLGNAKWLSTPIIGDNAREKLENWYYAVWAYNGFVCPNPNDYVNKVYSLIANCPNSQWTSVTITKPDSQYTSCSPRQVPATPEPVHVDADYDGVIDGSAPSTFTIHVHTKIDGRDYTAAVKLSKWNGSGWDTIQDWKNTPYDVGNMSSGKYQCEFGRTCGEGDGKVPDWYNSPGNDTNNGSDVTTEFTFVQEYQRKDWYARRMSQEPNGTITMAPGEQRVFYVIYRNEGKNDWSQNVHLGTQNPQDRASPFYTPGDWISAQRPTSANENPVKAAGADGKFEFVVTAPCQAGHYDEWFRLVNENQFWFDNGRGDDVGFHIDVTVPTAPVVPSLIAPGDGSCGAAPTLLWGAVGGGACGGTVQYYAEIVNVANGNSGWTTGTTWAPTGLAAGQTYQWHVKAKSNVGESGWSGTWSFHVNAPPNTPTLTSPASNVCLASRTVHFCWTDMGDPDNCPSGRTYRLVVDGVFDQSNIASTCQDVNVGNDGVFTWHVQAYDGQAWSDVSSTLQVNVDSTPPAAPTGLAATFDHYSAILSWTAADTTGCAGIAGYNVYRKRSDGGGYAKVNGALATDTKYTDRAANGVAYDYGVTAVDVFNREGPMAELKSQVVGKRGDLNGDGQIDITDVIALINLNNRGNLTTVEKALGDFNGDGKVDANDVEAMKKYILGK